MDGRLHCVNTPEMRCGASAVSCLRVGNQFLGFRFCGYQQNVHVFISAFRANTPAHFRIIHTRHNPRPVSPYAVLLPKMCNARSASETVITLDKVISLSLTLFNIV